MTKKEIKEFKNIGISKEAFNWLQVEKKRTKLSIYVIVDEALVRLSSLNKKRKV